MGGTFDPLHNGHLAAATAARDQLDLDRVLLVVANHPWQKVPRHEITPAVDRLAMVEVACEELRGLEASDLEVRRGGPSYTVDTVEELRSAAPGAPPEIFMVVGADLVATLATWQRADDLRRLVTLAVVTRPGTDREEAPGWRAVEVRGVDVDVSSSEVRRLLAEGRPVDGLVPDAVIRCIRRRALYAGGR